MSAWTLDDKGVIAACSHCGKRNRIPYGRLAEAGTCGQCRNPLPRRPRP